MDGNIKLPDGVFGMNGTLIFSSIIPKHYRLEVPSVYLTNEIDSIGILNIQQKEVQKQDH